MRDGLDMTRTVVAPTGMSTDAAIGWLAQQAVPIILKRIGNSRAARQLRYPIVSSFLKRADPSIRFWDLRNPVPTIWITHDSGKLHNETLARFIYHAEVLRGTRTERVGMITKIIADLPIDEQDKATLSSLDGLSPQQLMAARTLADLICKQTHQDYGHIVVNAATRSQKAMSRRNKDEARLPITKYSLDYVNTSGKFGPAQILGALKHRPAGSLCLYGLPGTGKTQFAEHIAVELGKPILIKRASDILNKYLGESEKQIAEIFGQAEEEDSILLLDEADSFLRDRSRSQQSWEITTVNELLQHMERFDGIFICTTNLYEQIDIAALRRFTFKLEFLPLNVHQRWEMFLNEAGLRQVPLGEKLIGEYEDRLALMKNLVPGDFATVKRQCVLLGESLSPEEWLSQLEIEVRAKQRTEEEDMRWVTP